MRSDLISGPRQSRPRQAPPVESLPGGGAAGAIAPLLSNFFGGPPPVRVRFWDGTSLGPSRGDTLHVCSPDAVRRMLWSPSELGLARAFVQGDLSGQTWRNTLTYLSSIRGPLVQETGIAGPNVESMGAPLHDPLTETCTERLSFVLGA